MKNSKVFFLLLFFETVSTVSTVEQKNLNNLATEVDRKLFFNDLAREAGVLEVRKLFYEEETKNHLLKGIVYTSGFYFHLRQNNIIAKVAPGKSNIPYFFLKGIQFACGICGGSEFSCTMLCKYNCERYKNKLDIFYNKKIRNLEVTLEEKNNFKDAVKIFNDSEEKKNIEHRMKLAHEAFSLIIPPKGLFVIPSCVFYQICTNACNHSLLDESYEKNGMKASGGISLLADVFLFGFAFNRKTLRLIEEWNPQKKIDLIDILKMEKKRKTLYSLLGKTQENKKK